MFTAKYMDSKIKQTNECPAIDFWIENSLVNQFINNPQNVTVSVNVLKVNNWTRIGFMSAMVQRGFHVKCTTDQRDGDFYTITYPPQGR